MTIMTAVGAEATNLRNGSATAAERDPAAPGLEARVKAVAAIAAANAVAVDRDARFPAEAFAAAKSHGLLGIMVPRELGGEAAGVAEVVDICYRLGRACSSTGMIYAMHQVKVACVVRHGRSSEWQNQLLRRLAAEQLLFASSTTEGQGGGNIRSSAAPIEYTEAGITLQREASVISYGAQADAIVTTARRSADAAASDQVLAVFLKDDYTLDTFLAWDTLGMRGTCSSGFMLRASGCADQLLPLPYDKIHAQTMVPCAHLMWSSVWAGIATAAVDNAQACIRSSARKAGGELPSGAAHFTKARAALGTLRGMIASAVRRYEAIAHDEAAVGSLEFQSSIALTKVEASEQAVAIVLSAMRACGLTGYRNDNQFAVGRYLRDILSSPLMISNDRILSNVGATSLMSAVPADLRDHG
jgi:acyl-CoA dehydrogenase